MDVGSPLGADTELAETFPPGEGALDRPADHAHTGADVRRRGKR